MGRYGVGPCASSVAHGCSVSYVRRGRCDLAHPGPHAANHSPLSCACRRARFALSGCNATLQVGPLSPGTHTLSVRTVWQSGGSTILGTPGSFEWSIQLLSNSTISLSGLTNGHHSLYVVSTDPIGHTEAAPWTYNWVVDTIPPTSAAVLLSSNYTRDPTAVIQTACSGEEFPQLCTYCWSIVIGVVVRGQSCANSTLLRLAAPADGDVVVLVTAVDAAGNHGNVVNVSLVLDTTPPATFAYIVSPTMYVAVLAENVINTTDLLLSVAASEAVRLYRVTMTSTSSSLAASTSTLYDVVTANTTVHIPSLLTGDIVIRVSAIDLVGNEDPTPVVLPIIAISTSPTTSIVVPPPSLSNSTAVTFTVTTLNEVLGLLAGFAVSMHSTPPMFSVLGYPTHYNATVSSASMAVALTQDITLAGLVTGTYHGSVQAYDVLGNSGPATPLSFSIDLDAPNCSFAQQLPAYVKVDSVSLHVNAFDSTSPVLVYTAMDGDWTAAATSDGNASVSSTTASVVYSGLTEGPHTFLARAIDAAGNAQPAPFDALHTIVDLTAPVVTLCAPQVIYTNNATQVVCVTVDDTSPVVVTVVVSDGDAVSVLTSQLYSSCLVVTVVHEGNHSVTCSALDAAGSPSAPQLGSPWFVFDVTAPSHVFVPVSMDRCGSASGTISCRSTLAVFTAVCVLSYVTEAPCHTQWAVESFASALAACSSGDDAANLAWTTIRDANAGVVNVTDRVTAVVAGSPVSRFVIYTRAFDDAGNVGGVQSLQWWVDVQPPQPPTISGGPDAVTTLTTAPFVFKLPDTELSPGQISFVYNLTSAGLAVHLLGGNPVIPVPAPVNTAPTTISLSGLDSGKNYTISVASVTLSGVMGTQFAVFQWHVLSSAPTVDVLQHPDSNSGSVIPTFVFAANWGGGSADGASNVTYSVRSCHVSNTSYCRGCGP